MPRQFPLNRSVLLLFSAFFAVACLSISEPPEGLSLLSIIGGNNQNVQVGNVAADPLTVQALDHTASPMNGVTVTWTITSGTGVLNTVTSTTDDSGLASVNFTAPATSGAVGVRATAGDLRVTFTVNVVTSLQ